MVQERPAQRHARRPGNGVPPDYRPSPLERSPLEATLTTGPHSLLDPGERQLAAAAPPGKVRKPLWRRYLPPWQLVVGTILFLIIAFVVLVLVAYARTPIPEPNSTALNQTTVVYYAGGKQELGRWQQEDRQIIPLTQVPVYVRNEVLSAEDRSFYQNQGVSPTGVLRATWHNLRGQPLQGGSTITQQFVKNYFLTSDRSYTRKWKELFIAVKVGRTYSKDKILENYLNTVYFGRRAHGIQAASYAYFGKPASQLTVEEGAFLAGILNGPELYDPLDGGKSPARALARWNYVLDGMVTQGNLGAQARAKLKFPTVQPRKVQNNLLQGQTGYLMQMVSKELSDQAHLSQDDLETGGYRIVTTFDPHLVADVVRAVAGEFEQVKGLKIPTGTRVGMAVIDPKTGAVKAIYGGTQTYPARGGSNAASQDTAQVGSTMKPFALIAALQQTKSGRGDITLKSTFDGHSPQRFDKYPKPVENYGGTSFSRHTNLIKATADSINTVYMNLNQTVGPANTRNAAIAAGVPADRIEPTLGNVLGYGDVHPVDMAEAYATIANGGKHHDRFTVVSVLDPSNAKVYTGGDIGKQVFDPDVIKDVTYAMQAVTKPGGSAHDSVAPLHRPVAGKTGTSSDHKSGWFNGFVPRLEAAVAIYRTVTIKGVPTEQNVEIDGKEITGGGYPARIWENFMAAALGNSPVQQFPDKADISPLNAPASTATYSGNRQTQTTGPQVVQPPPSTTPSVTTTHRQGTRTSQPTASESPTASTSNPPTVTTEPEQGTTPTPTTITRRAGGGG